MKRNVGIQDRVVRIAIGLAIGAVGLISQSWLGLIGLAPLTTGLIGWCPGYLPFGISTCKLQSEGS